MLRIYDQNKTLLGYIVKYSDLCIESDLSSGDKTLSFTYCAKKGKKIQNEHYIETKTDRYVVKEVSESTEGYPSYQCQLDLEDLEADMLEKFSALNATLTDAANLALVGTGWRVRTDIAKVRSVATLKTTPLQILGKIRDAWMCEMRFDNISKIVYFQEKIGEDKGVYLMRGLNLRKTDLRSDTYDYYTRIIPVGKDGLKIDNEGKDYVENHQYSDKVRTLLWEDTSYEDAEALKEDAEKKLEDMSKPKKSYSADVIDLAKQNTAYALLAYGLGDTVTLIDEPSGIRDKQRIVKIKEYPQEPQKNTCELSNTTLTFEEYQARLEAAAAAIENVTNKDGTINGVYVHGINKDGEVEIEAIINNSEAIKNLNNQISIAQGGIGTIEGTLSAVGGDLSEVKLRVGTIETTSLKATEAEILYAKIKDLEVLNQKVETIRGDYAEFKTITTDELFAAKGWMLEGSIGSAQISSLDVNKLNAGTLDTSIITVGSSDGKLTISDNTIQISDDNYVRVQAGKDASGDYTLAVWDKSGNLIFDALGATEHTIQRKVIRDSVVADDADIKGYKLDINSVVTSINGATTKISGTVVQVGDKNLNVALSEQTQTITEMSTELSSHAAKIEANEKSITLKVSTQEFTSHRTFIEGEIDRVDKSLSTTEQKINVMEGEIALKVEQADIDSAVETINGTLASYTTTEQMTAAIEAAKDSITTSVSYLYAKREELEETEGKITHLETWKEEASQKITKDGIIATVGSYYAKDSDFEEAKTTIAQHASEIALTVKKDGVIAALNLTEETAKISAGKIDLSGYVTISSIAESGQTIINGDNIKTGTISADRIDVNGIFARNITATGTISGVRIEGATGSFAGDVTATSMTAYDNIKVYDSVRGVTHMALSAFYDSNASGIMLGPSGTEVRCAGYFGALGAMSVGGPITAFSTMSISGQVSRLNAAGMWYHGRDYATIRNLNSPGSGWAPVASMKTISGSWEIGTIEHYLAFSFVEDAWYNSGTNAHNEIRMHPNGSIEAANMAVGIVNIAPVANETSSVWVTYGKTFPMIPRVAATLVVGRPDIAKNVSVSSVNQTGFQLNMLRSNTTVTTVNWIAIG